MTHEWARLRKYARRMRIIFDHGALRYPYSQAFSVLQSRGLSEPLLPNLQTLRLCLSCATQEFILSIPLFLSTRITTIHIEPFGRNEALRASSMVATFPTLCPNLSVIRLPELPREPLTTAAVSELVLATNKRSLRYFDVDSPLTEEAREVIYKHPHLCTLMTVVDTPAALPTMVLPNLARLAINYWNGHGWLQGFRGASLGKLTWLSIVSESDPMDSFLGAFETVALTTSIPETLSTFKFYTSCSWRPNYRSLLPFTQLKGLFIQASCDFGCSSTVDDDIITDLAQAMPELEIVQLGGPPCQTPGGVTVKGLAALAYYCPHLTRLCIHFQVASLCPETFPSIAASEEFSTSQDSCALYSLRAGGIIVPDGAELMVTLTLLHIFPCLEEIPDSDVTWDSVSEALFYSKRLARVSSKKFLLAILECY